MKDALALIAVCASAFALVASCQKSEWHQQRLREDAAQQKRKETPHVIREADGCKVYAFLSGGRYHYFTRCPGSQTTTESSYSVSCGKNCTHIEVETIGDNK